MKRKAISLTQIGNSCYRISRLTNCLSVKINEKSFKVQDSLTKEEAQILCENEEFSISITANK